MELTFMETEYEMTTENERDYWSGPGHISFKVLSHTPQSFIPYEIEVIDYSGCLGGLNESLGFDYAINEGILYIDQPLRIGMTYHLHDVTVIFSRGDGWITDDNVDYYVGSITTEWHLFQWLYAWWWHFFGHRIRNWIYKRGLK
jgi:hypothetical protein